MKSGLKYIDKIVQSEISKILKEENVNDNPVKSAEEQLKYDQEQIENLEKDIKKLKNWDIQVKSDIKSSQQKQKASINPIEKSLATTTLNKVEMPKQKDLKAMIDDKEEQLKSTQEKIKTDTLKLNLVKKGISIGGAKSSESISESIKSKKGTISLPMITRKFFTEQEENIDSSGLDLGAPKNKAYLVKFDKNTKAPFEAKFTERGFSINGTRLSFEALENALSKNYTITLNNGKGLVLDAIRMQKILNYKDRWFNGQQ
jgi:hypothetical protein